MRLDQDMRAIIQVAHLCFAATVTVNRRPNLSPKGTIRVWDDEHLYFLDIASPHTRANLQHDPWIELNVVDQLSRRGYRFSGRATLHRRDSIYDQATSRVFAEGGTTYPVETVVMIAVDRAEPLVSPGYWTVSDEAAMRAVWRERRAALDREFEAFLTSRPVFRVRKSESPPS